MATNFSTTLVEVRRALADLAEAPLWALSNDELAADLVELAALSAQVAELSLRVLAQADRNDVAADQGAATTFAFCAEATRQTRPDAKRRVLLANALDTDRHLTREAMVRGHVSEDQARVIVDAIDVLPTDLEPEVVALAEKELVAQAAHFDPKILHRLGKRILEVVAPDVADQQELKTLEREEARAAEKVRFTMVDDGHGLCHGRFTLPSAQGAMLRKLVMAHWKPEVSTGSTSTSAGPKAMGEAFLRLVERYPAEAIPEHGGVAATVVVSMTLDQLQTDGVATLDIGQRISAGEARRLACEAGIIPVLGGKSALLDVGRQARFHTKSQRIAIAQRDRTCTAEGCDHPPGLCHVHHDVRWSDGGRTTVDTGRLLCPKHHRMLHAGRHQVSPAEGGRLVFRRP